MSAAVNAGAPVRHRSRNPQQPKRSRYTDEAMSVTWYWHSSSRHIRLRDRPPPVAPCSDAAAEGRPVHRLTVVSVLQPDQLRQLRQAGDIGQRRGTHRGLRVGDQPGVGVEPTTRRIAASASSRSVRASASPRQSRTMGSRALASAAVLPMIAG